MTEASFLPCRLRREVCAQELWEAWSPEACAPRRGC